MSGAVVVLGWTSRFAIAAVAFVAAYFANRVAGPVESELLHERVDEGVRTTMLSIQSMSLQSGGLVAELGLGTLADSAGIPAAWFTGAAVLAVSSLVYLRVGAIDPDPSSAGDASHRPGLGRKAGLLQSLLSTTTHRRLRAEIAPDQ